jgi:TonB family protein
MVGRLFLFIGVGYFFSLSLFAQSSDIARNALVIGNSNYRESPLKNPENDAVSISQTLRGLGFNVIMVVNADKEAMTRAIRDFGQQLSKAPGVGLFYYAGHGIQSKGVNYLVPINTNIQEEFEIEFECVKADRALSVMEYYGNPFNVVILDACRNNPFRSFSRSADSGLAVPSNPPTGSIIAFATQPGRTASDGTGNNGLYTEELIKAMTVPDIPIEEVFKRVRINVARTSNQSQVPQEWSSLMGEFYFAKSAPKPVVPVQTMESVPVGKEENSQLEATTEVARPRMVVGQSQYLTGNVELKVLFSGNLFIDGELITRVEQGAVLPINSIPIGRHEFKIVGGGGTWSDVVMISENKTVSLTSSLPEQPNTLSTQEALTKEGESPATGDKIYEYLEEKAEYKWGIKGFYEDIAGNVRIPSEARRNNISGNVVLSFVVLENGKIEDIKVTKSLGYGWDDEAMRLLRNSSGSWKPGKFNGEKVKQRISIPIYFKIND